MESLRKVPSRRTFVKLAAGAAVGAAAAQAPSIPIIDTHIHLFDPTRPQGVPWPSKNNAALYRPALPERYRAIAAPLGIKGAIEVEASTWLEDNQWVLDVAAKDTIMVGTVGDLEPGKPEFAGHLERFHRNPLFRGIRCGNLWGRNLGAELSAAAFVEDLKRLSDAGLSLDTANPNPALIEAVVRVTDKVPDLRVIVDHLPQLNPPEAGAARDAYYGNLRELGKRPRVYVKISEVLRRVDGRVPEDLDFYRPRMDELFGIFGENRVLYGSDWPNSDNWAPVEVGMKVVREYFMSKGQAVAEKYFWRNSVAAYRWVKRDPGQPGDKKRSADNHGAALKILSSSRGSTHSYRQARDWKHRSAFCRRRDPGS
jgi:L-fuconolactonase